MKKLQEKVFYLNQKKKKGKNKSSLTVQVIFSPNRIIVSLGYLSNEELQIYQILELPMLHQLLCD